MDWTGLQYDQESFEDELYKLFLNNPEEACLVAYKLYEQFTKASNENEFLATENIELQQQLKQAVKANSALNQANKKLQLEIETNENLAKQLNNRIEEHSQELKRVSKLHDRKAKEARKFSEDLDTMADQLEALRKELDVTGQKLVKEKKESGQLRKDLEREERAAEKQRKLVADELESTRKMKEHFAQLADKLRDDLQKNLNLIEVQKEKMEELANEREELQKLVNQRDELMKEQSLSTDRRMLRSQRTQAPVSSHEQREEQLLDLKRRLEIAEGEVLSLKASKVSKDDFDKKVNTIRKLREEKRKLTERKKELNQEVRVIKEDNKRNEVIRHNCNYHVQSKPNYSDEELLKFRAANLGK